MTQHHANARYPGTLLYLKFVKVGWSPLHYAILDERFDVADVLLAKGAPINDGFLFLGIQRQRAAEYAMAHGASHSTRTEEVILPYPGLFFVTVDDYPPFLLATRGGLVPNRKYCIGGGDTPLHIAVQKGRTEVVGALLRRGADARALNAVGCSPLHFADSPEMTERLLKAGADANAPAWSDITPLHLAIISCRPDLVAILIAGGADPYSVMRIIPNNRVVAFCVIAKWTAILPDTSQQAKALETLGLLPKDGEASPEGEPDAGDYALCLNAFELAGEQLCQLTALHIIHSALGIQLKTEPDVALREIRTLLSKHRK